ncbi:MAG: hypothetical protein HY270_04715 [Deltaproteobacteria bacterium]|nr:hypothetical protein [Deltaproteobacteria bacterium]
MNEPEEQVTPIPRLDAGRLRALLPGLGTAGLKRAATSSIPPKGKLLKLKLGFNPNSSSVGTTVVVFLWSLVASGAVLAIAAALLSLRFQRKSKPGQRVDGPAADSGQDA